MLIIIGLITTAALVWLFMAVVTFRFGYYMTGRLNLNARDHMWGAVYDPDLSSVPIACFMSFFWPLVLSFMVLTYCVSVNSNRGTSAAKYLEKGRAAR